MVDVVIAVGVEAADVEVDGDGDAGLVGRHGDLDLAQEAVARVVELRRQVLLELLELVGAGARGVHDADGPLDPRELLRGEQALLAGVLRGEDRLGAVVRVEQRGRVVGVEAVREGDASERLGVAAAGAGDLTLGVVVAAEAEVAHRQVAAVDRGGERREARVALGEATRPDVARAGVVAVGGHVDAVDHEQPLVVLLEELTEVVGVLHRAERRVADAAGGLADGRGQVRPVHRVPGGLQVGGALRVAQRGGVPAAAGVDHDVEGALVALEQRGRLLADALRAAEGGGRGDSETREGCDAEKFATVHGDTSYSCKNL